MNLSKDFEQISFNPFNFFNNHDQQDMRDPILTIQILITLIYRMP